MKNIPFLSGRKNSQQVEEEVNTMKWTLERDKIELLSGNLTPEERFEYACHVFDINE